MTTIHRRSLAIAAFAGVSLAGSAGAHDTPTAVLTSLEARQLVARAEPEDHVRLTAHFSALADRYSAEAKRHVSMSQGLIGNPSRHPGTGMHVHCKRLANLHARAATTVRELAAYYAKLASGTPATLPKDGARFRAGAGAPDPAAEELDALAATASTPAEHRALEEYFQTLARRSANDAHEHVTLASTYRGTRIAQAAVHHERLTGLARDAATKATAAARMHRSLAAMGR